MRNKILIIYADDDPDDRLLFEEAFAQGHFDCTLTFAKDGQELLEYLHQATKEPIFILLDLNMPRKNGKQALVDIKSDERFRHIPVVVFTTSNAPEEIKHCYTLGANSYIVKPSDFDDLLKVAETLYNYWIKTVSTYDKPVVNGDF